MEPRTSPLVNIVIGMAGSGKTMLLNRLITHYNSKSVKTYNINLDPAVSDLAFPANIDIRDCVKYKEVMKKFQLGPNGAIVTSLNLFAAQFDEVLKLIDKKAGTEVVNIDTPGQIEVFSWSASGQVITDTLALTYPTIITYVVDTDRCKNPNTFMSNMLYALSIMYKSRLPMVVAFNKIDICSHLMLVDWMKDYSAFQKAIQKEETYRADLSHSMSLVLDEFYKTLCVCE
jgi:GTPase SAR1 family protein